MTLVNQKSTFPVSVGTRITGVDESTFSITGESFANITTPEANSHTAITLQKDDVSLGKPSPLNDQPLTSIILNTFAYVYIPPWQPTSLLGSFLAILPTISLRRASSPCPRTRCCQLGLLAASKNPLCFRIV